MTSPPVRTSTLDVASASWLVSDEGRRTASDAAARLRDGEDELAVTSGLRQRGLDVRRTGAAMSAAHASLRLPSDLASWGAVVFTRSALEQASDPTVAAWRARRFAGATVVDLGCGAGSDLLAMSRHARLVVGVERDGARAVLAAHNARFASGPAHVVVGDALQPPVRVDLVHADPSRRVGGRRARRLAEYGPPVGALMEALRGRGAGIVLSPAVAWDDPDLPADNELEFVQRGADLVEAVAWSGELRRDETRATATLLGADATSTRHRVGDPVQLPVGEMGEVLIEVAPAAVRARLHGQIGTEIAAWRPARGRALLTSAAAPPPSPWYRAWQVEARMPVRAKAVRAWLREADPLPLEIATSGLDADPQRWWRDLGQPPRGPSGRRLLLARLDDGAVALALRPLS